MDNVWVAPEWLDEMEIGPSTGINNYMDGDARFRDQLELWAIKHGQTIYHVNQGGTSNKTTEETLKFINGFDARKISCTYAASAGDTNPHFILKSGFLSVSFHGSSILDIHYTGTDEYTAKKISQWCDENLSAQTEKGAVYVITKTCRGFETRQLGIAGVELEKENYAPEVITQYAHVIDDFNSADPCGRLVLLTGLPGSGKTYLVRSLLKSCPTVTFVLLPPQLTAELAGPDLVTCVTNVRDDVSRQGPVVLVIEDGERCLLPRSNDNDMSVTSLLNICDGIFGAVLDIRVLVTTNEPNEAVDPALRRNGRLCSSIHVDKLTVEQAKAVYRRLTGGVSDFLVTHDMPLCDVYQLARTSGYLKPVKSERVTGFQAARPSYNNPSPLLSPKGMF